MSDIGPSQKTYKTLVISPFSWRSHVVDLPAWDEGGKEMAHEIIIEQLPNMSLDGFVLFPARGKITQEKAKILIFARLDNDSEPENFIASILALRPLRGLVIIGATTEDGKENRDVPNDILAFVLLRRAQIRPNFFETPSYDVECYHDEPTSEVGPSQGPKRVFILQDDCSEKMRK
jgi:hypothetical protein